MSTTVICPKCGRSYTINTTAQDQRKVRCKACSTSFPISLTSDTLTDQEAVGSAPTITGPDPSAIKPRDESERRRGLIGQEIGGCRIEKKIGQGGMGAVFKGHHIGLDITVAVKILPPSFAKQNSTAVDRFIREARAAAKLKHHNIVGVLNVGEEKGLYFIVMDFVDGESLQDRIDSHGLFESEEAADIVCQCCEALEVARKNGIIHRDIKPDNIMIDRDGVVKIADMGLAKRTEDDHSLTQSGAAMGTPHYMSPEQAEDASRADHRSDLYSLGCTFYHMVCGLVPYEGTSLFDVLRKHVDSPIPEPRRVNPQLPAAIGEAIKKLMAKEPDQRYQTAAALLQELRKIQSGAVTETVAPAKPVREKPRAKKSTRRQAAVAAAGSADARPGSRRTRSRSPARKKTNLLPIYAGVGMAALVAIVLFLSSDSTRAPAPRPPSPPPRSSTVPVTQKPTAEKPPSQKPPRQGPSSQKPPSPPSEIAALTPAKLRSLLSAATTKLKDSKVYTQWPFNAAEAKRRQTETADLLGLPTELSVKISADLRLRFQLIPAGEYVMGRSEQQLTALRKDYGNEFSAPIYQQRVRIARPFYLGRTEVTIGQFRAFVTASKRVPDAEKPDVKKVDRQRDSKYVEVPGWIWRKPHAEATDRHPACFVSFSDANAFCAWLIRTAPTGEWKYGLPSDPAWEYACRAGTSTPYFWGERVAGGAGFLNGQDVTFRNTQKSEAFRGQFPFEDGYWKTAPAGSFRPNAWGLYDMLGSVFERTTYIHIPGAEAPKKGGKAVTHCLRGGSWLEPGEWCNAAKRIPWADDRHCRGHMGFRIAIRPPGDRFTFISK